MLNSFGSQLSEKDGGRCVWEACQETREGVDHAAKFFCSRYHRPKICRNFRMVVLIAGILSSIPKFQSVSVLSSTFVFPEHFWK